MTTKKTAEKKEAKKHEAVHEKAHEPAHKKIEEASPEPEFLNPKPCLECKHPTAIHFEGAHRQCNHSGCHCNRYVG